VERVTGIGGVFLRAADITVEVDPERYPNGRFARLADPDGNSVQLWQPS
jgi:predicted enzyme related to lactoylglutathione lyase